MISITKEFDELLGGGLQPGSITHIYGPPASGKTNIALIATVNASKDGKVIYVDPEGGFSVERLKQIAGEKINDVLKNVLLIEPVSFDEQKVALRKLDEIISSNTVSLVVVDSIAMLYRLEEERDVKEFGRLLAQLLRIARRYTIPVLMTNQVYTDIDTNKQVPIGGDLTKYWAKIMIEVENEQGHRYAVLKKHKFLPSGKKLEFKIVHRGIEVIRIPSRQQSPQSSGARP